MPYKLQFFFFFIISVDIFLTLLIQLLSRGRQIECEGKKKVGTERCMQRKKLFSKQKAMGGQYTTFTQIFSVWFDRILGKCFLNK